ncbi:hypothetical protein DNG35_04025 [Mesonia sp. K7]|nr:phosphatase domain-containing protein [Mesonia sp. K7]PZD78795.1 hypothetical protein DNG35_04025 [Mesonia sp. K7]
MNIFKKDPLQIITFQSYGTDTHLYARGRALEDEQIDLNKNSWWHLLINSWKRFETDEIKHTELNLKLEDNSIYKVKTNHRGYFTIDEPSGNLKSLCNEEGWLSYEMAYDNVNIVHKITSENRFPGQVLIPKDDSEFGVISDIDDTILHTGVVSFLKWRVFFNTFFINTQNRTPLKGAAEFYHLLHHGKSGENANPIFYVSHSPWNLYRYLEFFLRHNNFPKGPILLRDFPKPFSHQELQREKPQKQHEILNILKMYPQLDFILIGDSGEKDADIYLEIAHLYPKRIKAIYLRSVNHQKKIERIKTLIGKHEEQLPILLVENSKQAIDHAKAHGFIAS